MKYEHYDYKIAENEKYIYYVSSLGYVYRKDKLSKQKIRHQPYIHHNRVYVKINGKDCRLATLIAKTFMRDYDTSYCVGYKDKDIKNCNIENLYLYSKKTHGKITGKLAHRNRPVVIQEYKSKPVIYRSVREAAKALYCSYQCLLDYLNGVTKKSVVKKYGRKIFYKEDNKNERD